MRLQACLLASFFTFFVAVHANAQSAEQTQQTSVEAAHKSLLAAGHIQTELTARDPIEEPKPKPEPNGFWRTIGSFLKALAPLFKLVFWIGVPLLVLLVLAAILRETTGFRFGRHRKVDTGSVEIGYRPDEMAAHTLLEDADALAANGEYEAAARLLLNRSIEDIETLRKTKIKKSLTSREIVELNTIPENARPAFAAIARVVERAVFAGFPLTKDGFQEARSAYERFALPEVWR